MQMTVDRAHAIHAGMLLLQRELEEGIATGLGMACRASVRDIKSATEELIKDSVAYLESERSWWLTDPYGGGE